MSAQPSPEARLLPPLMLTVADVSRRTGASARTVQRWCASGILPCTKVGRFVRIEAGDLVAFLRRHKVESA